MNRLGKNDINNNYYLKLRIRYFLYSYRKDFDFKRIILKFSNVSFA